LSRPKVRSCGVADEAGSRAFRLTVAASKIT
jgi:hypothetical protein